MSKPGYAIHSGACGTIEVDGKKLAVGSFQVDGVQKNGVWTTQGDDRVLVGWEDVTGAAEAHPVSEKTLEAAKQAWQAMEATDKWWRSSGKQSCSAWSTVAAASTSVRRTEIAVRLLGEMLRARIPSAEVEADFAVAITRLAIEGDGERMTKLAFFLADQVLTEEKVSAGNH